jgi:hypothetical protein
MTNKEIELLNQLDNGKISVDELLEKFPPNILGNYEYIKQEFDIAVKAKDRRLIEYVMDIIYLSRSGIKFIDELNQLVLTPEHKRHQELVMVIQELKDPSSIPFLQKALENGFDIYKYTCSEDDVIAKWFSHALCSIGTTEATQVIKDFSKSENEEIAKEMKYRLSKIK